MIAALNAARARTAPRARFLVAGTGTSNSTPWACPPTSEVSTFAVPIE